MGEWIELANAEASARVALRGAELKSWRVDGRELIWPGDDKFWPDSAPILFPIVGWTRDGVRVDGVCYPLGLHGFARMQNFELIDQSTNRALLALTASTHTRKSYPFAFRLEVEYSIDHSELTIVLNVMNEERIRPLPFACGLHPGFVWPLPGADGPHIVRFDVPERPDVPVIAPGGLFSTRRRAIPMQGRELRLTPELFEEALCFLDAKSNGLEFAAADGAACLRMEVENFPHLALWSRAGAPFLCLEAWTGHGDPVDFDGDIFAKPSMRVLAPGEKVRSAARFIWRSGNIATFGQ